MNSAMSSSELFAASDNLSLTSDDVSDAFARLAHEYPVAGTTVDVVNGEMRDLLNRAFSLINSLADSDAVEDSYLAVGVALFSFFEDIAKAHEVSLNEVLSACELHYRVLKASS